MKKTLSIALMLMLVVGLFSGFSAVAEEKTVVTIGANADFGYIFDFDVYKKAQEDLNIEIEFIYYNTDSFNAMLAGGDMPDIVSCSGMTNKILDNNLAMDIAPYIEEYAPNLMGDTYSAALALTKELMGGEEKAVYIIAPCVGPHCWNGGTTMTERGYVVNWEYYKEIGCPPITNDDDYIEVLKQMQANHPTTEDGSPTYLYGVYSDLMYMGGFRASFLAGVDVDPWSTPYLYDADIFENNLVNGYTDYENSAYWHDMEFLNKLYHTGNFDMDVFTMTPDELSAKAAKGQYMGLYADYYGETYVVVPSTGANTYTNLTLPLGNSPDAIVFIPKDTENWQAALKLMNYVYDPDFNRTAYSGVEGKDWNYDENGVPHMTEEAIAARAAGEPYWNNDGNGYSKRQWMFSAYNQAALHPDGYPMDLAMMPDTLIDAQSDLMRDFCEVYEVEFWHDAFPKIGAKDWRNGAEQIVAALTEIPMDVQRVLSTCDDIMYTAMPSLIMAEDEEEFAALRDEVLAELAAADEETAWNWFSEQWVEPRAFFVDLLAEAVPAAGLELYPVE